MNLDFLAIAPTVAIAAAVVVLLMVDVTFKVGPRWWATIATIGFLGAMTASVWQWVEYRGAAGELFFSDMLAVDGFSSFAGMVVFPVAALGIMAGWQLVRGVGRRGAEFVALAMIAAAGAHLMAASANLVLLFIALEVFSISLYILAGFTRKGEGADEAALKYFLLGALASAVFLYGVALVFAATGTTSMYGAKSFLDSTLILRPGILLAGIAFLLVGLGFKVSAAPFHVWAPDVYQGSPGGVTGFLAAGAKVAGFAALARVLVVPLGSYIDDWAPAVAVIAALSVLVGTLLAIAQTDLKRMLAYSSVAHAGFIMTALVAGPAGVADMWFYLSTYALQVVGAFAIAAVVSGSMTGKSALTDYAGLGSRSPLLAGAMALFMLAMAGIPLTAGFVGKAAVFRSAIDAGYLWVVILGLVAAVGGLFFYLRVIVLMYMQPADDGASATVAIPLGSRIAVLVPAVVTLVVGVVPWPLLEWVRDAIPL
jgi:NADH-quinone oxidoreductase subunit N